MAKISEYFDYDELCCKCGCKEMQCDKEFIHFLDVIRRRLNNPIIITSGYRCKKHNEEVGGVKDSSHVKGCGVDIRVTSSYERFKLLKVILDSGVTRIGIGKTFIHIDTDSTKPQNVIWTY